MNIQHEGVTGPNYPDDSCQIAMDATDFGLLDGSFQFAVMDHGNDRSATWPCFTDNEKFSVTYEGKGTTLLEGSYWGVWLVTFKIAAKTLRVDVGKNSVERFDLDTYVPASFSDISDLVAAFYNLNEYNYQQRLSGSLMMQMFPSELGIKIEGLEPNPDEN